MSWPTTRSSWIRKSLRNGAHIGAVADAAFFLARAGLLDGHACTLHWTSQAAFVEAFPDIELRRDLYVIDRKRFTSAGGVGSLDMMLEIIARDYGAELAAGVAEWFVHSPLRSSVDRKLMPLQAAHRRPQRAGAVGHRHHGGCGGRAAEHVGPGDQARRILRQARAKFSPGAAVSRPTATTAASG